MRTVILLFVLLGTAAFVGVSGGCVRRNDPTLFIRIKDVVESDKVVMTRDSQTVEEVSTK